MAVYYSKENRNWMFWLVLLALFCVCVYVLRSVLLPFAAGIIIGYLLQPVALASVKTWGIHKELAV